jgi:GTP pyrophosphokinase
MERKAQKGIFRNWNSKAGMQGRLIREIQEMFDVLGSEDSVSYRDVIAASGIKEIYTYTPQGDLIRLPVNSTVLDFAFQVHTEIGQTCLGAMIRNKRFPADHVLKDGEMVRIIRADQPIRFEQQELTLCRTPRARGELAKSFRIRLQKVTREVGLSMLRQEMLRYGIPFDVMAGKDVALLLNRYSLTTADELYIRIGEGRVRLKEVIENIKNILYDGVSPLVTPTGAFNKIELTTLDPVSVKLSSCCKPNPTAKDNCALLTPKGLSVHHKNCQRFRDLDFQREDAVNITWKIRQTHVRKQQILHILRATRKDIMAAVGAAPVEMEMNSLEILSSYSSINPAWQLTFSVPNLYALQKVLRHFDKSNIPYEFYLEC